MEDSKVEALIVSCRATNHHMPLPSFPSAPHPVYSFTLLLRARTHQLAHTHILFTLQAPLLASATAVHPSIPIAIAAPISAAMAPISAEMTMGFESILAPHEGLLVREKCVLVTILRRSSGCGASPARPSESSPPAAAHAATCRCCIHTPSFSSFPLPSFALTT